jgi:ribonucleoside-diphosphate reductase alpha chain
VNNSAPEVFKKKGLKIYASNLCSEICLPSDEFMSFVCNLASMNILHFEEWEGTDAVEILFYFLDAVMSEYIDKVKEIPFMQAAYKFAVAHRAIGLGALGWQSFLQSKMIPFESFEAKMWNVKWAKALDEKTLKATKELAALFGEPEIMEGTGMRNSTRIAIAPTTSSSFILRCSKSVEVESSNYFVQDLAKGKFTSKNPYLKKTLHAHDKDDDETWRDILVHGGSVQHLSFLNENEKDVFKTFGEISQKEIIIQAAQRQNAELKDLIAGEQKMKAERRAGIIQAVAGTAQAGLSDQDIAQLIEARNAARAARHFAEADRLRQTLADAGIVLEDSKGGTGWRRA